MEYFAMELLPAIVSGLVSACASTWLLLCIGKGQ